MNFNPWSKTWRCKQCGYEYRKREYPSIARGWYLVWHLPEEGINKDWLGRRWLKRLQFCSSDCLHQWADDHRSIEHDTLSDRSRIALFREALDAIHRIGLTGRKTKIEDFVLDTD